MEIPIQFDLKYGHGSQRLYLSGKCQCQTLHPSVPTLQLDEQEILRIRMRNPLASRPLEEILKPGDRVLLVVPDKTRVARLSEVFQVLFPIFRTCKIPDENITVIFANGSHPRMSPEEKRAILGETAASRFRTEEHDCYSPIFEKLGTTRRGTPVMVNPILRQHDKVIVIGSVVHHYFAGFGGGPKMIVPGLAAYETILQNHRLAVLTDDEGPLHPECRPGNLQGNPVYEDIQEAAQMVPVDFAIQLVLDEQNRIVDAFCGDLYSSFQKASLRVHYLNAVGLDGPADVVIASAGGYPKDLNLIQAHKAMHYAAQALKKGGILLLLAECRDGWGNPDVLEWFSYTDYNEMKKAVQQNFRLNANTALAMKFKLDRYKILLVSELPHDPLHELGFFPFPDVASAVKAIENKLDGSAKVYIIPNASVTLPILP